MAPRNKHKTDLGAADRERFGAIFAQMEEAGLGKPATSTAEHTPTLSVAATPVIGFDSYEGMTRVEKLFKAIDLGDAATIRDTVKAKFVRNKDGSDSNALIEPALSLVPTGKSEALHFPEPMLHRAVRSQQMASVLEIVNLGIEQTRNDKAAQEKFFNATRKIDGATVLHDLAASIPAGEKVSFTATDHSKWNPGALIALFIANGTDVMAKADGKTAADMAPNASVKKYLRREMDKILAEDQHNAMRWQAKHAREIAAEGPHLSRIR